MKKQLIEQSRISRTTFQWLSLALIGVWGIVAVVVTPPSTEVRESGFFIFCLLLAICGSSVALYLSSLLCLPHQSLVTEWENSSGLHHWTELPKKKAMRVTARADLNKKTMLGVEAVSFRSVHINLADLRWFVQFDRLLPDSVKVSGEVIILDSPTELLHSDAEREVVVLLTGHLYTSEKGGSFPSPETSGIGAVLECLRLCSTLAFSRGLFLFLPKSASWRILAGSRIKR